MDVSITEAKARLPELVRRAEAGDEVVLTRHGHAAVRLVAVEVPVGRERRRAAIAALQEAARTKAIPGPGAARSQDFLYDEDGLPT